MSLRVDNGRSRGRSKSPGRKDERSRSRDVRAPSPAAKPKKVEVVTKSTEYYSDEEDEKDKRSRKKGSSKKHYSDSESDSDEKSRKKHSKKRYDSDDSDSDDRHGKKTSHRKHSDSDSDDRRKKKSSRHRHSDSESDERHRKKSGKKQYESESSSSSSEDDRRSKRKDHHSSSKALTKTTSRSEYEHDHHSRHGSHDKHEDHDRHARPKHDTRHYSNSSVERQAVYQAIPGAFIAGQVIAQPAGRHGSTGSRGAEYASVPTYEYAQNEHKLSYSAQPQYVEAKPLRRGSSPPSVHRLSIASGTSGLMAPGSSGRRPSVSGGRPPGSPLLEAYRGTYQSISPMPSPLMLASKDDSDLSDLEPLDQELDSDDSRRRGSKSKKKVSFYDPESDAVALAAALKHSTVDPKPIVKILPYLSDDHVLMLRTEYKKHMKAAGKGVNIAKHIKMKVSGNLGKVAYAVALGRWESEAHWANFWYQANTSRRELLIESLMGRTNSEIVKIKDAFHDQRYNDSLEKCMQTELKKDKFRTAVLLALEEKRMDEKEKLSIDVVRKDAKHLYEALTSREGGETAMINIIVVRSNKHLAETLRVFEAMYRKNFAREMIQKSRNLVGETLAHIINGVLNRPVRDALLLHQALAETSKDRTDLLVSRLVRFHWEPRHLAKVKEAYKSKYGTRLEQDVEEGTKGDFGEFCCRLCRVPDS